VQELVSVTRDKILCSTARPREAAVGQLMTNQEPQPGTPGLLSAIVRNLTCN